MVSTGFTYKLNNISRWVKAAQSHSEQTYVDPFEHLLDERMFGVDF